MSTNTLLSGLLITFLSILGSSVGILRGQTAYLDLYLNINFSHPASFPPFYVHTLNSCPDSLLFEFDIPGIGVVKKRNPEFILPDTGTYLIGIKVFDKNYHLVSEFSHQLTMKLPCQTTYDDTLIFYTPNNYGGCSSHEVIDIKIIGAFSDFHLTIFNRWGEIIFESFEYSHCWDFTHNGQRVKWGKYIYFVEFIGYSGIQHKYCGQIDII